MKVCFVGVGSIAHRHIKNLAEICNDRGIEIEIDIFRSGMGTELDKGIASNIHCEYRNYEEVPTDYDIIFITNPTQYHLDTIKKFYDNTDNFFVEKPIISYEQIEEFKKVKGEIKKTIYVACPLRYKSVIQYLKKNIDRSRVYCARAICSSYLPDWRPQIDYRNVYSAKKELGGGVAIDLIHEWDYLNYLFGKPQKILCMMDQISHLEIDSEDIAVYLAKYNNMFVELHLDYFGRVPMRQLRLFTEEDTILCDLIENQICYMKSGKKITFQEERDDFQKKEISYFLDIIDGKADNFNDADKAVETLKLSMGTGLF